MSLISDLLAPGLSSVLGGGSSNNSGAPASSAMDPQLVAYLQQYYNTSPNFASEWQRQHNLGDTRSPTEWLYDHISQSPQDQDKFLAMVNTPAGAAPGSTTAPLEQDLLNTTLNDYIYPDMALDPGRVTEANNIKGQVNTDIDKAVALNNQSIDGTRLTQEYGQAGDTKDRLAGSVNTQADSLTAALNALDAQRRTALDPLLKARTAAADTDAAAVNQGLESERDRLTAEQALQGFYGGSSMDDANQLRATIAARQGAAQVMGQANVANATDTRGIGDDTAKGGFQIAGQQASGLKDATDSETNMRQGYFDNDYTRAQAAALQNTSLDSSRFGALTAADAERNSGLNRSLQLLDWFAGGSAPPTVQPTYTPTDTSGADIAGLGTGIFSGALNVANANKWWQTTPTANPGAGAPTSYAAYLAANPNSSAVVGQY